MQKDRLLRREFEFDAVGRLSGVHTRAYDLDGRVLHDGIRQELAYMPGGRLLVEDSKWQQNRGSDGETLPEALLSRTHHVSAIKQSVPGKIIKMYHLKRPKPLTPEKRPFSKSLSRKNPNSLYRKLQAIKNLCYPERYADRLYQWFCIQVCLWHGGA